MKKYEINIGKQVGKLQIESLGRKEYSHVG
jgi:hypothetical protein